MEYGAVTNDDELNDKYYWYGNGITPFYKPLENIYFLELSCWLHIEYNGKNGQVNNDERQEN